MSKIATQNRTAVRTAPYPTANSRNVPIASTSSSIRRPPPARAAYRIDKIMHKGVATECLTIEDTPPLAEGAGAGSSTTHRQSDSYASTSRYDSTYSSNYEPAAKKRKNEGAHVSDQPYASTSNGYHANGQNHYDAPANGYSSKNKRKADALREQPVASGSSKQGSSQKAPEPIADKDGHYIVRLESDLVGSSSPRYRVKKLLGQGTFGKVVQASLVGADERFKGPKDVAIKVIRNVPKYREASRVEVAVLERLKKADPTNKYKCIHLELEFDFHGHRCLVSELLSSSVFDFLKENHYQPFPASHIQQFAKQLLTSVQFVHDLKYIHTDLKPENILLESADFFYEANGSSKKNKRILKNSAIRLIDFGSATAEKDYHATVVSTRHYRAPEIILGTGWSYPCDVWSIGCILIEFYTGEALFQTHENVEHLAMMRKVFGEMPDALIQKATKTGTHPEWFRSIDSKDKIDRTRNPAMLKILDFPTGTTPKQSQKFVKQMRELKEIVKPDNIGTQRFLDLLEHLLQWEPEKRITVAQALKHPYFKINLQDSGNPHRS